MTRSFTPIGLLPAPATHPLKKTIFPNEVIQNNIKNWMWLWHENFQVKSNTVFNRPVQAQKLINNLNMVNALLIEEIFNYGTGVYKGMLIVYLNSLLKVIFSLQFL